MRLQARHALMSLAFTVLIFAAIYGFSTYDPTARVDTWAGPDPAAVVSGNCKRKVLLLPTLSPRPPDFVRYHGRMFTRRQNVSRVPPQAQDTHYWYRSWHLFQLNAVLYLRTADLSKPVPKYVVGNC